jgi:hypothetical protein
MSFGKVPAYTDISHFRAPYKNAYIAGFGGSSMRGYGHYGYGTEVPPAAPPPPPNGAVVPNGNGAPLSPYVVRDERGYFLVKPAVREQLMKTLSTYGTTFLGGPTNRHIIKPFAPEILAAAQAGDANAKALVDGYNAAKWVKDQLAAGQVVFGLQTLLTGVLSGQAVPENQSELGVFPTGSAEAKDAAKAPFAVVFAGDPDKKVAAPGEDWMAKIGGPIGVAVIAGVAVGGVYLLTRKKKRAY